MPQSLDGSLVSGLIDPVTKTWDQDIIRDIFSPTDVNRIVSIPVCPDYEDSWYWNGDPRGCYTVKDGYRRICGEINNVAGGFDKWLSLWKIKSPPKWRTFLWRALSDILPIAPNLILKRVDIDPTCPMCGQSHESLMHTFILCEFSTLVWHASSILVHIIGGADFCEWFSNAMDSLSNEQLIAVVAVLYHLWKARNMAVWDGCLPSPRQLWNMANAAIRAWGDVHCRQSTSTAAAPRTETLAASSSTAGDPPYSCFFDAGYQASTRRATVGAILLSAQGTFLAAFNGPLHDCFSPLMAESVACKEVLSWIRDRGLTSVALHTDCTALQRLLSSEQSNLHSYVGFSLNASKAILSSFTHFSISVVPRSANQGAHSLASIAYSQAHSLFWDTIPPNFISALI
ncbi:uncharacterized protein LOC116015729 [Ipomoea triloba]|uniref:uncharacterized protein LOC116015729 n=1 Tax=Ipomoea triloba TaxID=35885 RepID=UPI00125D2324|nr:uncharacterized protein LOC116015729 [Ipomoea triloba]